jgi:uncharacterized membrane protein
MAAAPPSSPLPQPATTATARLSRAGGVLGFALGGFFDGILLHQVLQWHHLFSLVPGERWRDIKNQILMDGWFHVLHYLIAVVGLWLLWQARDELGGEGAGRRLLGSVLLGFAVWQAVDTVLFHWVLAIHRVRVDMPNPLFWDIGWFVVVGGPPLVLGFWLRGAGGGGGTRHTATVAAAALAASVLVAGPVAALPPPGSNATVVLFRPGIGAAAFGAVAAIGGRVVWADPSGELLAIETGPEGRAWRLYGHGALLVGNAAGPFAGTCLAWSRGREAGSGGARGR